MLSQECKQFYHREMLESQVFTILEVIGCLGLFDYAYVLDPNSEFIVSVVTRLFKEMFNDHVS
jgi:hypothetical protein